MNLHNIKTTSVKLERVIQALPEEVFDAWLDPACKGSPWNAVDKAIVQPVVDGLFYRMHLSEHGDYELAHYGRFVVVDRPNRIQYTWVSQHTRGLESLVTFTLQKQGNGTRVVLVHQNLPDDDNGRLHEQGWQYYLGELVDALATRTRSQARSRRNKDHS